MGRLFWNFFLFFWLAQVATTFGVSMTIWLLHPEREDVSFLPPPPNIETKIPPSSGYDSHQLGDNELHNTPPGPQGPPGPQHTLFPPLLPLIAGSLVSLLFAALLAWYFSRPIRSLRQAFKAVASGRFETRIGGVMGYRHDELADLASGFDRMAERLQGLVDKKLRLLHDVSHELRSPLARLQAAADLMRQQPERCVEFVELIERDTGRMDRLVGELLTLARLDAGITEEMSARFDLNQLMQSIAEDAKLEAEAKQCRVDVSLPQQLAVHGNRELIRRAIENVVRNALRHTPSGGNIFIAAAVEQEQERVIVEVADEGDGVTDQDLNTIFEPFIRSASEDTSTGYGLGLAITRSIVEAHGGEVYARNRPEGGLAVTICLRLTAK